MNEINNLRAPGLLLNKKSLQSGGSATNGQLVLVVIPSTHSLPAILRPVAVGLGTVHGIDNTRDRIFALIRFHTHFLTLQDNSNVTACRSKY
jgi:hypothetical protein